MQTDQGDSAMKEVSIIGVNLAKNAHTGDAAILLSCVAHPNGTTGIKWAMRFGRPHVAPSRPLFRQRRQLTCHAECSPTESDLCADRGESPLRPYCGPRAGRRCCTLPRRTGSGKLRRSDGQTREYPERADDVEKRLLWRRSSWPRNDGSARGSGILMGRTVRLRRAPLHWSSVI